MLIKEMSKYSVLIKTSLFTLFLLLGVGKFSVNLNGAQILGKLLELNM